MLLVVLAAEVRFIAERPRKIESWLFSIRRDREFNGSSDVGCWNIHRKARFIFPYLGDEGVPV